MIKSRQHGNFFVSSIYLGSLSLSTKKKLGITFQVHKKKNKYVCGWWTTHALSDVDTDGEPYAVKIARTDRGGDHCLSCNNSYKYYRG